jgi:hypothetical protein
MPARHLGRAATAGAVIGFAACLGGWLAGGAEVDRPWAPTLGRRLDLALDGLGALYGLLATGIGALVFAFGAAYLPLHLEREQRPARESWRFWPWMALFMVAMAALPALAISCCCVGEAGLARRPPRRTRRWRNPLVGVVAGLAAFATIWGALSRTMPAPGAAAAQGRARRGRGHGHPRRLPWPGHDGRDHGADHRGGRGGHAAAPREAVVTVIMERAVEHLLAPALMVAAALIVRATPTSARVSAPG